MKNKNTLTSFLRATYRALYFGIGSIFNMLRYKIKAIFVGDDFDRILRIRMRWFQLVNKHLGVVVETFGEAPKEPGLLVCNHRSYFDPIPILAQLVALPVGKADMKSWPVIGAGAKMSGVIFVERESVKGRASARQEIVSALEKNFYVLHFPEGTTHIDSTTIDFHPATFKDAATNGFPIYPVVLEFQSDQDAWIGDDSFVRHFFECFGKKHTRMRLSYGPKLTHKDTGVLMEQSKKWIDAELLRLRKDWHFSDPSMKSKSDAATLV